MWNGSPGGVLRGAEEAPARGAEEASLDSYIEKESPLRDFVRGALQHAPWWTMSFLVHLIALFVVCRWPAVSLHAVEVRPSEPPEWGFKKEREDVVVDVMPNPTPPPPVPFDPTQMPDVKIGPDDTPLENSPRPEVEADVQSRGPGSRPVPFGYPDGKDIDDQAGSDGTLTGEIIKLPEAPDIIGVTVPDGNRPEGKRKWDENRRHIDGKRRRGDPDGGDYPIYEKILIHPIKAGLIWLAAAQEKDGSWNAKEWGGASPYRVGMTGLALLAFEGMGYTHKKGEFQATVNRGVEWLRKNQRPDGSFPWETFYEQGIATMAACEAYGMTGDSAVGYVAQSAIDYICRLQPEHGGFRYNGAVPKEEGDLSVTGWQIMALKSAIMTGLKVPPQAIERSRVFLANTSRDYGTSSYLAGAKEPGSLAVTAIGMACRVFLSEGHDYDGEIMQAAQYLRDQEIKGIPARGGASGQLTTDLYYTYYSTLAMFQLQEEYWASWRTMFRDPLIEAQEKAQSDAAKRYIKGSWDPARDRWGSRAGRVYSTAMALLSLEVQYRFIALYKRHER